VAGEDLSQPKYEFPSVNSVIDVHYFSLEELIETMESVMRNPKDL